MAVEQRTARGGGSRRELTEIAIDCFAKYGFRATSIDRIAKDAGVTKGAIYYHFRDKEELLLAAVGDRVAAFENRVQHACEGADPADALRRIADVCVRHAESDDRPRFTIKLMVESIGTNERVHRELRGMMRRFRAFLRNIVIAGQEQHVFRADADPVAIAASYTSSFIGAEIQYYQDPERFDLRRTLEVYLDQLMTQLAPAP